VPSSATPLTGGHRLPRVESLTGLRWFAALGVFVHHYFAFAPIPRLGQVAPLGVTGVSFFFVLSGFVLTWSFFERDTAGRFYWRRFARIYPLVVVSTLVALPVFYGPTEFAKPWDLGAVTLSLVLLHAWFSGLPQIFFAGNPASWSLSCEAFFYALFPAFIRWFLRRSVPVLLGLAALLVVVKWVMLVWVRFEPPGQLLGTSVPMSSFLLGSPVARLWEFLLGVAVGSALRRGWRPPVGFWTAVALLAGGMVFLVVWAREPAWATAIVQSTSAQDHVTAPLYALLIAAAATLDVEHRASFLRHRVMVHLGQWSYAFYLTHATVLYALRAVFGRQSAGFDNLLLMPLVLALTVLVAWLAYRLVEHPAERRLRGMLPPIEPDHSIDPVRVQPEGPETQSGRAPVG
jgi:peptidoglycan/LPS O-acetylase OafA/YrhL